MPVSSQPFRWQRDVWLLDCEWVQKDKKQQSKKINKEGFLLVYFSPREHMWAHVSTCLLNWDSPALTPVSSRPAVLQYRQKSLVCVEMQMTQSNQCSCRASFLLSGPWVFFFFDWMRAVAPLLIPDGIRLTNLNYLPICFIFNLPLRSYSIQFYIFKPLHLPNHVWLTSLLGVLCLWLMVLIPS